MKTILTAMAAAAIAGPAGAQDLANGSFCERLAGQTGMSLKADPEGPIWSARLLNVAQRLLIGGRYVVSIRIMPSGVPTANQMLVGRACQNVGKTTACRIEGPAELTLGINGKESKTVASEGQRARVELTGTRISCRET